MYYTHEFSLGIFNTYDECKEDLLQTIEVDEYASYVNVNGLLRKFFRRKSDTEFCAWFEIEILKIEDEISNELIVEYEGGMENDD